ncbi:MAG: hypothetical protein JWO79_977 [Actinomycetia bacterium]|jgi:hypothetical protein|nr:hypothetical protein [Actinomycetes bacterium]MDQ1652102.1 hypothetical protein [Cryptosporangiaceae bacterium]MDQ1655157.1 hypothetical protein [Cryptosporangiaceae bacterium]
MVHVDLVGRARASARQSAGQDAGWGMVFAVALLGLALAAAVILTPWHLSDVQGGSRGADSASDSVVKEQKTDQGTFRPTGATRQFLVVSN